MHDMEYKELIYENAIEQILPVYGNEERMLVIHTDDFTGQKIKETICVQLFPMDGKIGESWSLAKMLKYNGLKPIITEAEKKQAEKILLENYSSEQLSVILDKLLNPGKEAMETLVLIPPRLKNYKPEY